MILLRVFFFILVSFFSHGIFAGEIVVTPPTGLLPQVGKDPTSTIASIIAYGIGLAGVLAVMAITWASIQMIIAAGDEEKIKKSRNMIIYAFIGIVVAGIAYGAVRFMTNLQLDTFL